MSPAVSTAIDMLKHAPSLAQNPGLPALVAQLSEMLDNGSAPTDSAETVTSPSTPATETPADNATPAPDADATRRIPDTSNDAPTR